MFPNAEIDVLLHGINPIIEQHCSKQAIRCLKIYEDKEKGLDIYDNYDLHVGFRIHAHVSALSRRKYSYLLEQDGRGNDYGLTIERKLSVNSFVQRAESSSKIDKLYKRLLNIIGLELRFVDDASVDFILSVIRTDYKNSFAKFDNLERQILSFNDLCLSALSKLP